MDQKGKMILVVFKVFLKNKRKRRKLKCSRLLRDIRRNNFLKRKKKIAYLFY